MTAEPTRWSRSVDVTSEPYPKRRIDAMSALMVLVTLSALAGAAWMRFGRSGATESWSASVGAEAPPLRLLDLESSEPMVLVGLNSKVVWVVFWSARAPSGPSCLTELKAASKRLRSHRRFAMVTAAVESDDPAAVRAAMQSAGVNLPVYLAGPDTRRRFHAENADPPLHVLIDAGGRILAMARGDLDPIGETRFAARVIRGPTGERHHAIRRPSWCLAEINGVLVA
jgi:peroxiredoxin